MKVKTKLVLSVGLLFLLITLLAGLSIWYINSLKKDTENILVANYNTLAYSRNMINALDHMPHDPKALETFGANLLKQKANLTEPGEASLTARLTQHFNKLKLNPAQPSLARLIRADLSEIMRLNMSAIVHKSNIASKTANNAILWTGITGALCFAIAFTLLINLPGNVANPIRELTASIKQIASQNYQERVYFESHSEFGELARSFNTMASKLEEYAGSNLSKILMEKRRIDTLVNNMHDPVIGLDEKGKILFVNNEALHILGLDKHQLVGRQVNEVTLQNDLLRVLMHDLNRPHQEPIKKEPIKIFANGKESYFEKELLTINIVPAGEVVKQHIGSVILLKNITPFRELDLAKTNFIATISHELKTPISSIKMSLHLLHNEKIGVLNAEQMRLLEGIGEDSDRLLRITGELLNMSQVETGNIQLNLQKCNPMEMVHYAMEATKVSATQKDLSVKLIVADHLPLVKADAEKTAWVLTNFLSNAIRYSPEQAEIILSVIQEDNDLLFAVKDNGRGIDARYATRIFERYFQIPGSSKAGSGLGLAISKEFIEAQGGTIGVESALGQGSRFFFRLAIEVQDT